MDNWETITFSKTLPFIFAVPNKVFFCWIDFWLAFTLFCKVNWLFVLFIFSDRVGFVIDDDNPVRIVWLFSFISSRKRSFFGVYMRYIYMFRWSHQKLPCIRAYFKICIPWKKVTNKVYNLFFYKHTGKLGWSSICLRFSELEPEIMLDGMLNFKTHCMVWYCLWYEHCHGLF